MFPHISVNEKTPAGILPAPHNTFTVDKIHFRQIAVSAGRHHQNTFEVTPKHVQLTAPSRGVRFNVETVPEPLPDDLHKPRLSRQMELDEIKNAIVQLHTQKKNRFGFFDDDEELREQLKEVRIEATSEHDPNLIYRGGNGFIVAVVTAFAQHLPLELSPDHFWALITYSFAKHVEDHAEELRHLFVSHEGKRRILIDTRSDFKISRNNNPDTGATAVEWEQQLFAKFSSEIRKYVGDNTHAALTADFSTTTPSSRAASEIVLMAAMKNYFSFGMRTMCGIPEITLLGTEDDWVALRNRTEVLGQLMIPSFANYWLPALIPVLDEFIQSYRGCVNHGFWQTMVKLRHNGAGSGYCEYISGWVQIFFPHINRVEGPWNLPRAMKERKNDSMRQWNEMYFLGPEASEFPLVESFAPCDWDYHGQFFDLEFHAGIIGVRQDPATGTLSPVTGWYVIHELPLPKPKSVRIAEIEKEINDLLHGHKDDYEHGDSVDEGAPWSLRVFKLWRDLERVEREED